MMLTKQVSRRRFLAGAAATGLAMVACDFSVQSPPPAPDESPIYLGKHAVARAILGQSPGTAAMPTPSQLGNSSSGIACPSGDLSTASPPAVPAIVYYPAQNTSYDPTLSIQIDPRSGPYPVVLYAHAKRLLADDCPALYPQGIDPSLLGVGQDYTRAGYMLAHVASYGCVVVVPDLGWLWDHGWEERAVVLVSYYQYLEAINQQVFSHQLDLGRAMLVGHSTGGGACLVARGQFLAAGLPAPLALGLLAPATSSGIQDITPLAADLGGAGLMVLRGTADTRQVGSDPEHVYAQALAPKIKVTIPGANHFGFTDTCTADLKQCAADDNPGTITRLGQQLTGGAYLAALLRKFVLGDATVEPYLNGSRIIEVDGFPSYVPGVSVVQVGM
jgi:hypothetical protein